MLPAVQTGILHSRRLVGAALLLVVFLLPLHFHFVNALPLINEDCTCYSGVRTQLGLLRADSSLATVIQAFPIVVSETHYFVPLSTKPHASRAPPTL
jgi:hypothetical protein